MNLILITMLYSKRVIFKPGSIYSKLYDHDTKNKAIMLLSVKIGLMETRLYDALSNIFLFNFKR